MSRKTFIITILFSSLSTSSFAFTNFASFYYLGIGVGPNMATISEDAYLKQFQNGILSFNVKNRSDLAATGVFGSIFGGYATQVCLNSKVNLYLALELNANLSSLEHDALNYEFVHKNFSQTQIKMKSSYGASFIPGVYIASNAIFYGRVGYSNSRFKISSTDTSIGDKHTDLNGFRWGLGLQHAITPRVALRLEFSEIYYRRTHTFTFDTNSDTTKYTSFKPNVGQVEFGIFFSSCSLLS